MEMTIIANFRQKSIFQTFLLQNRSRPTHVEIFANTLFARENLTDN